MTPAQLAEMGEPPSSVAYLIARPELLAGLVVPLDWQEQLERDKLSYATHGVGAPARSFGESWPRARDAIERLRGEGKATAGGPTVAEAMMLAAPTIGDALITRAARRAADFLARHTEADIRKGLISLGWTPPPG